MTFIKNNSYILLIFFLCIGFTIIGVHKSAKEQVYKEITVSEGDSLWALAYHHADKVPVNQWIEDVMKINDLQTSTIKAGAELRLPTVRSLGDDNFENQLAGSNR